MKTGALILGDFYFSEEKIWVKLQISMADSMHVPVIIPSKRLELKLSPCTSTSLNIMDFNILVLSACCYFCVSAFSAEVKISLLMARMYCEPSSAVSLRLLRGRRALLV